MGLEDRIKRLEARAGQAQQEDAEATRRRRLMDKMLHAMENGRRELDGRDPLPTPPELEDTREDIVHALSVTIPHYRRSGGWGHGDGKEILDRWEDDLLEKLTELHRRAHRAMGNRYTKEDHEKYREQVEAREQREAEARRESAGKGAAYAAWIADGGSAADFEREWPKLRDAMRARRLVDADERAQLAQRNTGVSRI